MNPFVIDLTRPLGKNTETFIDGDYSDPEFSACDWSSIDIHGFRVSSLRLGTQTGTHIDAPAHFDRNGACLDSLAISELMGSYYIIDLDDFSGSDSIYKTIADYRDEEFLFIRSSGSSVCNVAYEAMEILLAMPPVVWVLDGVVKIEGKDKYFFNRMLAESGKYLVEDIDPAASGKVLPGGEFLIFPLRLENVSGSPCRVVVRYS